MGSFGDGAGGLSAVGDGPPGELSPRWSKALPQREGAGGREGAGLPSGTVQAHQGPISPIPGPAFPVSA